MPNIKELEQFKNELREIANEPEVLAKWGEKFDEIALPDETIGPNINLDQLLQNVDAGDGSVVEKQSTALNKTEDFDEIPLEDFDSFDKSYELQDFDNFINDNSFAPIENFSSETTPKDESLAEESIEQSGSAFDDLDIESIMPSMDDLPNFDESTSVISDIDTLEPFEPAFKANNPNEAEQNFNNLDIKEDNDLPQNNELIENLQPESKEDEAEIPTLEDIPEDLAPLDLADTGDVEDLEPIDIADDAENLGPIEDTDIADDKFDTTAFSTQDFKPLSGGDEISLYTEERDEQDIQQPKKEFTSMLSDLDVNNEENISDSDETDINSPDVPEELLSGFNEMVETARKTEDESLSSFDDLENLNDTLEPLDDFSSFDDSKQDISTKDSANFDSFDPVDNKIDDNVFPDSNASNIDINLDDFELPSLDDNKKDTIETLGDVADGDSDFNADISEPIDNIPNSDELDSQLDSFSSFNNTEEENEPVLSSIKPIESVAESPSSLNTTLDESADIVQPNFTSADIPELDEHTAFAIDDDVLDTDMGNGMDEFSVPESFTEFSPDKNTFKFTNKKEENDDDYDGKIPLSISEADYNTLIERISSFPLNLRLEIEDYLANGDDSELNKMEIVNLIVKGTSLKKIANKLETILEKSIPIPKSFDKKSYEEYERLKKTFKYRFVHKVLPVAILFAITAILVFSMIVLSWQFIYKPIVAERIYKDGFANIEGGQYSTAIEKFDEAGTYTKKRKWYFNYANLFKAKKQFLSAEAIYKRLLFDFNHDVQGGCEYADMLSTDLRNYEKAEKVLRRGVLDFHINDKNALLALGDVYLEWADENSEKYEDAKKTFLSLINMYGENDVVLGRMMRYFIRTDNLAEVLPLKDHFMGASFNTDELVEVSGYILEKRYEPKPSDSDKLRGKIEDVRELLEKAIKATPQSPEANYNLGRYFIYNRKPNAAKANLETAIKLYQDSIKMSPKRLLRELDSMRLYGELITNEKQYNEAQEIYAKALSKYEDYVAQKRIYQSNIIGKLYADYADISYFISGDYESALNSYQRAVQELNDTPSIRYRIGYIHYKNEDYIAAMKAMTLAYTEKPTDKNLLYGFGNVLFKRGNYFAAQAYYERLMEFLEAEKIRKGIIFPQARVDHAKFAEDYMHTSNNLGVVLNRIAVQNGDSKKNGRAISLLGESTRAWDTLSRNPETMIRSKAINLGYANIQNIIKPRSAFEPEIYSDIPKTLENEKVLQQLSDR